MQPGSTGVKQSQTEPNEVKRGQTGSNGVKQGQWGQTRPDGAKQGRMGQNEGKPGSKEAQGYPSFDIPYHIPIIFVPYSSSLSTFVQSPICYPLSVITHPITIIPCPPS